MITPNNIDVYLIKKDFPNLKIHQVKSTYLSTYQNFNLFKINPYLYRFFNNFKYLLFYELDAFVFHDSLIKWCNEGYDYIGAPWFEGYNKANKNSNFLGVGNGGFSLRNTERCLEIANKTYSLYNIKKIYDILRLYYFVPFSKLIHKFNILNKTGEKEIIAILNAITKNEDYFWGFYAAKVNNFNVAPFEVALRFSFETNPSLLYEMNDKRLPFGCHAWEKYEPEFWKQFIQAE